MLKLPTYKRPPKNKLFNFGNRKPNVILSLIRMKCSGLNSHMKSRRIVTNATCQCGCRFENASHYFLSCPMFANQRRLLKSDIPNDAFNIRVLLYGNKKLSLNENKLIIAKTHQYILATRRFINWILELRTPTRKANL